MVLLTKTKYMAGLQCPRLLWFTEKKLLPEVNLSTKHIFSQGHELEDYVKLLCSKSVDLNGSDFKKNLDKTREAMNEMKKFRKRLR
jgi:hypothetical protein